MEKLANNFCGIVRAIQSEAAGQGIDVRELRLSRSIKTQIAGLAYAIRSAHGERFSADYLQRQIERVALDVAGEPIRQETRARFTALLAEFDAFAERKLCVAPVEGVALVTDDPVAFGPFTLRRATRTELDRIHTLTIEAISHTLHTTEERAAIASNFQKHAEESLATSVLLEFEVSADSEQAHTIFLEKAGMLVDLLQMSTTIAEFCRSARIGLRGYPHSGSYSAWVLPLNSGDWFQPNMRIGGLGDLPLSDGNLALMRRAGVMRLAEALGRKATLLESVLLRAVHWYSEATLQKHVGHETLCLVVSLESVLGSSSGRANAESVALLVGTDSQNRRHLYSLVLDAYSVRHIVVHEGKYGHAFSRQEQFRSAVLCFIQKGISLCDDLIRRVGELRFS